VGNWEIVINGIRITECEQNLNSDLVCNALVCASDEQLLFEIRLHGLLNEALHFS